MPIKDLRTKRVHMRVRFPGFGVSAVTAAPTVRRLAFVTGTAVAALLIITLVALSPLALEKLGLIKGANWERLSNIGQTYGAASALLTALALLGVAGSILFQARAIRVDRAQSSGELQLHLAEMSMDDPVYQRCWAVDPASYPTRDGWRQQVFLNLVFSYWERDFVMGGITEYTVRALLMDVFRGEAARRFWATVHEARMAYSKNWANRQFCQVANEEYYKAVSGGPPAVPAEGEAPEQERIRGLHHDSVVSGAALLLGAACGTLLGRLLSHHSRNIQP
jgi:hypothetical protein